MASPSINLYNEALDALQSGNAPVALASIVNSLTEDPNDTETWKLYIVILNALGRTEDARRATLKLKERGISEVDEVLMKAAVCLGDGDLPGALSHYHAAVTLEPERSEIHTALAMALMESGDPAGALASAERAVELDAEDAHAHYAFGRILRLGGKKDQALESLTRAVSLDRDFMMALYEQGMLLAERGDFRKALGNFQRFQKANPNDPSAAQAIASVRERINGIS